MEVTYLYVIWACTIFSVILVPKERQTEASIIFLFQQGITWFLGIVVAEWDLIEYPVREFASVNRTSFTYEFLVFPVVTVFYILHYPENRSLLLRFFYSFIITTILVISEVVIEKYTKLIKYVHWEWYVSWISIYVVMHLGRFFHKWFFKFSE